MLPKIHSAVSVNSMSPMGLSICKYIFRYGVILSTVNMDTVGHIVKDIAVNLSV